MLADLYSRGDLKGNTNETECKQLIEIYFNNDNKLSDNSNCYSFTP